MTRRAIRDQQRANRPVTVTTPHVVIEDLPPWCGGATYSFDGNVITMRVLVELDNDEHIVPLEMTPAQAGAILNALSQCLQRAEQAARVLDIDPNPAAGDD